MASRRENLHSIYVLLFAVIAFYILQRQDVQRYAELFAFVPQAVMQGEVWRLVTFQFLQGGLIFFFFELLILWYIGVVIEDAFGTFHFLMLFVVSSLGSAAAGFALGVPLLGVPVFTYTTLFVFAHMHPEQVFYIFGILPMKVKWLAWIAMALLGWGLIRFSPTSVSAVAGAAIGFGWYLLVDRSAMRSLVPRRQYQGNTPLPPTRGDEAMARRNLDRFGRIRHAIETGTREERERLSHEIEKEIVPGVNICPPADYKPENADQYCIHCEGFAECSVRYLKLNEPEEQQREGESDEESAASV
ncbi:MAG: rhomboid family intramembrane serine protease [Thermoanaerobaculia bacterium]